MKVLVLDASYENALAIVRCLGKINNIEVTTVGYYRFSVSFFSKFCKRKFVVTNPENSEEMFLKELLKILKDEKYDLLIPVGSRTNKICVTNQKELGKYTKLIVPSPEAFDIAINKVESCKLANKMGVGCPGYWQPESMDDLPNIPIEFPLVVKAPLEMGLKAVKYAYSKAELEKVVDNVYNRYKTEHIQLPLIQELIVGELHSFFAYYESGVCKAYFMHRRIREFPIKGGSSVCAESIYDEALLKAGKALLDKLSWNGVAMIEFKKDERDGIYKLIEINPKFWKSLEMAIEAGVNFPYYLLQNSKGEEVVQVSEYKKIRFQSVLYGEFFHFLSRPWSLFNICRDLFRSKNDVWLSDIVPNLMQVFVIPIHLYKIVKGK